MATLSLDDPRFQPLTPEEEEKRKKQKKITEENKQDLVKAGTDETDIELPAEDNSEVSGLTSFAAGVVSGAIKIPEGVVSITAELMDLGAGQLLGLPSTKDSSISAVAEVEQFFDKLNPGDTAFNITKFRREASPEILAKYKGFKPYTYDRDGNPIPLPLDRYRPGDIIYDPISREFEIFDNAGGTFLLDKLTFEIQEK